MAPTTNPPSPDTHPPFALNEAQPGGIPTPLPDTPLTIIFLLLFTLALILSLLAHHLDLKPPRPPRLLPSLVMTFTLTCLGALATRLAWTYNPTNLHLEIASTILTRAAPILLLNANLLLARRFLRDYALAAIFCAVASLVMGVSVQAGAYYTREERGLREGREIGLVADCIRVAVAVVPVVAVGVGGWVFPCPVRELGERERARFRARRGMVCGVGALLTVEEGFWTGVAFEGRGVGSRAWFLSRAAFYCFGFLVEVVVVYWFLAARVDSRFRLRPRGARKTGVPDGPEEEISRSERLRDRVNTEVEVFGDSG
ncbi:hypothetical protein C8A01DRAFT_35579 [Parachaetomium inaequale]|uniref:Uncharacterized protein n=1 Tax=Parachaetomium inaequale TaxID=2588326 RepID=A0AAN6PGX4_9PEZI|nr:hypothetical protein C8A01DRAFT_35579 [Parachaetomium inaequale]